jgi:hypothetical protein
MTPRSRSSVRLLRRSRVAVASSSNPMAASAHVAHSASVAGSRTQVVNKACIMLAGVDNLSQLERALSSDSAHPPEIAALLQTKRAPHACWFVQKHERQYFSGFTRTIRLPVC